MVDKKVIEIKLTRAEINSLKCAMKEEGTFQENTYEILRNAFDRGDMNLRYLKND